MRGFVFATPPFPTMAINAKDSYYGRAFTILHELSHIILNISAICDPLFSVRNNPERIEQLCNRIAGETLVPDKEFLDLIKESKIQDEHLEKILKIIATHFKVSYGVSLQKLFQAKKIHHAQFLSWLHKLEERRIQKEIDRSTKKKEKKGGPTFYVTYYSANSLSYIDLIFHNLNKKNITHYSAMKALGIKNIDTFATIHDKFCQLGLIG